MNNHNYYYYDPDNCRFVPIFYSQLEKVIYTVSIWIVFGVILTGIGIATMSKFVGTPAEIALKAENRELITQLNDTRETINQLDQKVEKLASADNEIYRTVLGLKPIPDDERMAGMGGADIYSKYEKYSDDASEILKWTAGKLENLERRISIQKASFSELKQYYNKNQQKMRHLPVIKPTPGIIISGYGMRFHPVLKYKRMHDGIDFRATVGSKIYATGDGKVVFAGRKGTYGYLLEIDHGYGYVTRYAHLSKFVKGIRKGTKVKRGELVAYSGNSGITEGPHLHYEILKDGKTIDPINFLFADLSPEEFITYKKIAETNMTSMD